MARVWRVIMIRDVRLSLLHIVHDTHSVRGMYLKMGYPITGLELTLSGMVSRPGQRCNDILSVIDKLYSALHCNGQEREQCLLISRLSATACLGRRRPISRSRDDWSQ
jgi:hypothetical protein